MAELPESNPRESVPPTPRPRLKTTGRLTHGHSAGGGMSLEYCAWRAMIQRCFNQARGIQVCARWSGSFEAFLADMGRAPSGTTLELWPNRDGNFEPGNCRRT